MTVSLWGTRGVESSKSKMWVGVAGNRVFCTSLKNVVLIGRLIMNQLNFGATAWPSSVKSFSILHSNCAVTNCFVVEEVRLAKSEFSNGSYDIAVCVPTYYQ